MTDDEIITALELCSNRTIHSCKSCPCNGGVECNEKLNGGALNLINRQRRLINRLKNELNGKVDYIHEQQEIIDALKDNYNKKKIKVECTFDKELLEKTIQKNMQTYILPINKIRNGGIKDFAIEIEKELMDNADSNGDINSCLVPDIIHRLVKEMTEDK